jgi:hypothetical protein
VELHQVELFCCIVGTVGVVVYRTCGGCDCDGGGGGSGDGDGGVGGGGGGGGSGGGGGGGGISVSLLLVKDLCSDVNIAEGRINRFLDFLKAVATSFKPLAVAAPTTQQACDLLSCLQAAENTARL